MKNVDFDKINLAMFKQLRENAFDSKNKSEINMFLLLSESDLESQGFFEKYSHLR